MTRQELEQLKQEKMYFTIKDLASIFDCGDSKASGIMRGIKLFSDTLRLQGKITVPEFEAWFNYIQTKNLKI